MPLYRTSGGGWKYGKAGHIYHGAYAYDLAVRQGRAIAISKARRAGHNIPYKKGLPIALVHSRRTFGVRGRKVKIHKRRLRVIGRKVTLHRKPITHHLRSGGGY